MKIEYLHASKYGDGAMVAEEFSRRMSARGVTVDVHHIREAKPGELPPADLYLFSSPGRFGKPIRGMRRFLKQVDLPAGTKYAILTTEAARKPDRKTGQVPTEEEVVASGQRVRPIMREILQGKGLVEVAEDKVFVTGLKGPLEDGWQSKVEAFAARIPVPGLQRVSSAPAPRRRPASAPPCSHRRSRAAAPHPGGSGPPPAPARSSGRH